MIEHKPFLDRIGWVLFCLLILFQIFTLGSPALNGDEALGGVILMEEAQRIREGLLPHLTPFVPYIGPFDAWVTLVFYFIAGAQSVFILRLGAVLAFAWGSLVLARELSLQEKKNQAGIYLLLLCSCPWLWIHTRISWSSSYLFGTAQILLAETWRARRTKNLRPRVLALVFGISAQLHPTSFVFIPVVGLMNFRFF